MAGYIYRGDDPWAPQPAPEPKPPRIPRHTIPLQPCGTRAAWRRHQKRGEEICPPCREAKRNYDRAWGQKRYADPKQRAKRSQYNRAGYLRRKGEG